MEKKYNEYKNLSLTEIAKKITHKWNNENTFKASIENRKNHKPFIFYEGPPSANGMPGIHHVMARTIKDIFCRYKTMKGYLVERKAGWDTHGLPVEIGVEKKLNISKEDIGSKISISDFNAECKKDVMKYKDQWDKLTEQIGYWVDLNNPYITFHNKYIETIWFLLKEMYQRKLLYKGYTIQPYSPAAGTGLSTHELNQPGCYKPVKDNTVTAQFKIKENQIVNNKDLSGNYLLAWTTTPWTLPSNTALAVGENIEYLRVETYNQYTYKRIIVILAKDVLHNFFNPKYKDLNIDDYKPGEKIIPYKIIDSFLGKELYNIEYEQLLPYVKPEGNAFKVIIGDFVNTEEGTGIVHIAPSFGADDFRMAKIYNLASLTLVNKQGRFVNEMGEFAGRYVKPEYDKNFNPATDNPVDVDIIIKLKKENKAFKAEKYEHSYPHCWRTDKPILYYPLDSWFIKTSEFKHKLIETNNKINWKPNSTGTGRFHNWLENIVDWNLSRSRFWGTPLPIWRTEDGSEEICIGSFTELKMEIEKSIKQGYMKDNPLKDFNPHDMSEYNYEKFNIHRPFVDEIILTSPTGKPMYREKDLIDVWFDSGAMPYAQFHYPFENKDNLNSFFPADFIAEGVDQTRGWFYTLHVIATLLFDNVAFKNVISNGLVLDKHGNKMSKRLGNAIDPFEIINKYGPDPLRWYMISNSQPWDNLKFDEDGVAEVQRKLFGTLFNTYNFFAIYANLDNFKYTEQPVNYDERPELDRWILSSLNTLIQNVNNHYENYEPTKAAREIEKFIDENLSNWYVRLSRRRFWKNQYSTDKISAYQTLYECLISIAKLMAPIAPFFAEQLFNDLNEITGKSKYNSVHLENFPESKEDFIDKQLEETMDIAQKISSLILSLRKKVNIRVRQPLSKIIIPNTDKNIKQKIDAIKHLILSETNIKNIEYADDNSFVIVKKAKPNFKSIGPKYGKLAKEIASCISQFTQEDIQYFEKNNSYKIILQNNEIIINNEDLEIISEDIPGWLVANSGNITIALDITITPELRKEGIARELINKIQNLRKELNFNIIDNINIIIQKHPELDEAINEHSSYIKNETLAVKIITQDVLETGYYIDLFDEIKTRIIIEKIK